MYLCAVLMTRFILLSEAQGLKPFTNHEFTDAYRPGFRVFATPNETCNSRRKVRVARIFDKKFINKLLSPYEGEALKKYQKRLEKVLSTAVECKLDKNKPETGHIAVDVVTRSCKE